MLCFRRLLVRILLIETEYFLESSWVSNPIWWLSCHRIEEELKVRAVNSIRPIHLKLREWKDFDTNKPSSKRIAAKLNATVHDHRTFRPIMKLLSPFSLSSQHTDVIFFQFLRLKSINPHGFIFSTPARRLPKTKWRVWGEQASLYAEVMLDLS